MSNHVSHSVSNSNKETLITNSQLNRRSSTYADQTSAIIRDPIFSRFEKLYGLQHDTYHIIHLAIAHVFMFYYDYLWFTGRVPWKTVLFGNVKPHIVIKITDMNTANILILQLSCWNRTVLWLSWRVGYHSWVSQVLVAQNIQGKLTATNYSYDDGNNRWTVANTQMVHRS